MLRIHAMLLALLLTAGALAGCATEGADDGADDVVVDPTPDTNTPTPDATEPTPVVTTPDATEPTPDAGHDEDFALKTAGVPEFVRANESFSFTLYVNGSGSEESNHIGAHYADAPVEGEFNASAMKGCEHQSGTLPGEFTVTCTIPEAGTAYVYGHARFSHGDETLNFWSEAATVQVIGDYELSTTLNAGVPNAATVGQNFTFTMTVDGPVATSDHVGAHYGPNQTENPSVQTLPKGCEHQTVTFPNEVTVTCVFAEAGTYYLNGHVRFGSGSGAINFWTPEQYTIVVV